jgi:hypothetical protein
VDFLFQHEAPLNYYGLLHNGDNDGVPFGSDRWGPLNNLTNRNAFHFHTFALEKLLY